MRIYYTLEQQLRHMKRRLSIVERVAGKASQPVEHVALQLLDTENLNDVLSGGTYMQPKNVNTSGARNYPFNRAGWLEVVDASHVGTGGFVFQTYQEYGRSGYSQVRRAWRSFYNNSWSAWRVIGQNETIDLTSLLASGFNERRLGIVVSGGWVELSGNVAGGTVIPTGGMDIASAIPARFRPDDNKHGASWHTSGWPGTAWVRPDGTIAVAHQRPGGANSAQFTITYKPTEVFQ